jgi:hypothetical protein
MKRIKAAALCPILSLIFLTVPKCGISIERFESQVNKIDTPVYFSEGDASAVFTDCFEYAESVTGFSAEILRGIAATESHFRTGTAGDGGMSRGMFQLHSRWHESRVEKWGRFDPDDPFESAVIAARIMSENLTAFDGDLRLAIAAYRQGVQGVKENGVTDWYIDAVLNWRNNFEKVMSFYAFLGITNIEVLQDEYKGTGTQNLYKLGNSPSVQVSRRGSSGFSQEQRQN